MASTYMNIGGHIAALRKARGLTQEQLAAQLGGLGPGRQQVGDQQLLP